MNQQDNDHTNGLQARTSAPPAQTSQLTSAMVVGLGAAGLRHLSSLRELGVERLIAVSTGRSTHPKLAAGVRDVIVERSLDEGLAHGPQVVVIATPTSMHLEQAIVCAQAGCHLLIETPLSHTCEGLDRLQRSIDDAGTAAMVGYQFRFHPLVRRLRGWLRAGRLGAPLHATASFGEDIAASRPWEDYRRSYAARDQLGGGVIRTLGHPLDYLVFLLGNAVDAHASVRACQRLQTDCPDDAAAITMTHPGGVFSVTTLDFARRPAVHTLSVVGEDARASLDFGSGRLVLTPATGEPEAVAVPAGFGPNALFRDELAHLISQITAGSRYTDAPVADSASLLRTVLEARDAAIGKRAAQDMRFRDAAA